MHIRHGTTSSRPAPALAVVIPAFRTERHIRGVLETIPPEVALEHGPRIIVKMDGDGQMDPGHLGCLVDPIVRGRADDTKVSNTGTRWEFPPKLVRGCLRRTWSQNFVRDFTALALLLSAGLMMVTAGGLWGLARWWRSWRTGIPASTGTVVLAVLPLILGVQRLLQALVLDLQAVPRVPLQRRARQQERVPVGLRRFPPPIAAPSTEGFRHAA